MPEEVIPRPEEIGHQCLARACKELQAVLEHQVLTSAHRYVLLHSRTDELDVENSE